jgi:transcriptional regulator with XRE-family HTH domain
MRPMEKRLTNRLRQWRIEHDLSQQEVADLAGVDNTHWSRAERGLVDFAPLTRVRIARRLGVRVADLFDVDPVEEPPADTEALA